MSLLTRIFSYSRKLNRIVVGSLCASLVAVGCTPTMMKPGPMASAGKLTDDTFITADNSRLRLSRWSVESPRAIIIALHGFNDYRRFFSAAAEYLKGQQIYSYTYDQRGFGESAAPGFWAGNDAYVADLLLLTRLVANEHPGVPIYLLGESMGGAVVIDAMSRSEKPAVAGVVLSAPAVWGRAAMPWYQTSLLWTLSHTMPWLSLTGKGLDITPSDNIDMLRALGRDPWVIKETRVDAIYGLTNLMDAALAAASKLNADTLLLYGEKDQIVPRAPTQQFVQGLINSGVSKNTIAYYQNGYHMLLRDLQAPVVWQDIAWWILNGKTSLPSGADRNLNKLVPESSPTTTEAVFGELGTEPGSLNSHGLRIQ